LEAISGPLFRQLARLLISAIDDGEIAVGDTLPTEAELAQRHGVSRHTVRQALAELRTRGMIESRQGIGSIVVRRSSPAAYTENYSSVEELTRFAKGTPLHVMSVEDVVADAELAEKLRTREKQGFVLINGARYDRENADMPVGLVEVYVDATYGGIRDHARQMNVSVAETIEKLYGISIARIEQEIAVELLTADQAASLGVAPDTPALVVRRWYSGDNGRIFEIAFSRYPMGRFAYRNVLLRRDQKLGMS
jgi:GntR family transcriptional regulator